MFLLRQGIAPVVYACDTGSEDSDMGSPLYFDVKIIRDSIPGSLWEICAEAELAGRGTVQAERFWATLCVCNALELMEMSWLQQDDEGEVIPLTIVDKAHAWCKEQATILWGAEATAMPTARRRSPATAAAKKAGEGLSVAGRLQLFLRHLMVELLDEDEDADDEGELNVQAYQRLYVNAKRQVEKWAKAWTNRIKNLRSIEQLSVAGFFTALQRSAGQISLLFLVKHETFRSSSLCFAISLVRIFLFRSERDQ